jgi:hypothetical protein
VTAPAHTAGVSHTADRRHQVAVVRVEVRDADNVRLRIELLEVGHDRGRDRLLGRATNAADACRMLDNWLRALAAGTGTGPLAPDDGATDR